MIRGKYYGSGSPTLFVAVPVLVAVPRAGAGAIARAGAVVAAAKMRRPGDDRTGSLQKWSWSATLLKFIKKKVSKKKYQKL